MITATASSSSSTSGKRTIKEAWAKVEHLKPAGMTKKKWQNSYEGITAVFAAWDMTLLTNRKEWEDMIAEGGAYAFKKVQVRKNGHPVTSQVNNLLTGLAKFPNAEQRAAQAAQTRSLVMARNPKGTKNNIDQEHYSIVHLMTELQQHAPLQYSTLWEARAADVALRVTGMDEWGAIQVKTSRIRPTSQASFMHQKQNLKWGHVMDFTSSGMGVVLIALSRDTTPTTPKMAAVWAFKPCDSLPAFDREQQVTPMVISKRGPHTDFGKYMSEVGYWVDDEIKAQDELCRLGADLQSWLTSSGCRTHPLRFWNEDESQVPRHNMTIEMASFQKLRDAVEAVGGTCERLGKDAGSKIDFYVQGAAVQDKVASVHCHQFRLNRKDCKPLAANDVDVLVVGYDNIRYVIPMRVDNGDSTSRSHFTAEQLSKHNVYLSKKWKEMNAPFLCDIATEEGALKAVQLCEAAKMVPHCPWET